MTAKARVAHGLQEPHGEAAAGRFDLRVYVRHYNEHRPHRALGLAPPDRSGSAPPDRSGSAPPDRSGSAPPSPLPARVERRDLLGGLVHEYRAAA